MSDNNNESILARVISIILHPLLMTIYGVCLLFVYTDFYFLFAGQLITFLLPVFFMSCFIPASSIYFLKKGGFIKDYALKDKEDRFLPFAIAFISYGMLVYFFYKAGLYIWFLSLLGAPLLLIIIAGVITFWWKISAHMIGIGALIGGVMSVCYNVKGINPFILFIILFILAGCLGVARLVLKRHTPAQVYAGFVLGFAISYFCVWFGANWVFIIFK